MKPAFVLPAHSVPPAAVPASARRWIPVAMGLLLTAPAAGTAQCPLGATGADAASMAIRLKVGDSRRLVTTWNQSTTQMVMGQEQTMHQMTKTGIRYDVLAPNPHGKRRIRLTYESMSTDATSPLGSFSWSSSDTTGTVPPLARTFAALVGRGYMVTMDPDGSNRHVEGGDSVANRLLGAMNPAFRGKIIGVAITEAAAVMPPQAAPVGASWSCTSHTGGGRMAMIEKSTWTVESRSGGVTKVKIRSEMASDSAASASSIVQYALKGIGTSTMEIEDATGWIIRSQSETAISGSSTMDSPMGLVETPMNVKIFTTTEPAVGG